MPLEAFAGSLSDDGAAEASEHTLVRGMGGSGRGNRSVRGPGEGNPSIGAAPREVGDEN
jgi:hypothetical protein